MLSLISLPSFSCFTGTFAGSESGAYATFGKVWTPGMQKYELVDGNSWNVTTALTIDGMTGTKTMVGNVSTTFVSAGNGTAYENYSYTNTETGSVSSETETLVGATYTTSTQSYSYSNSLSETYYSNFVYDDVTEGWLIVGGHGNASGARSWSSNASTKTTTEGYTQFGEWSSVETTINSGNYSDTWSSTSAYLNGGWVLTSGTMSGSGNTYEKQSTQDNEEGERYNIWGMGIDDQWEILFSSSKIVDETFTIIDNICQCWQWHRL